MAQKSEDEPKPATTTSSSSTPNPVPSSVEPNMLPKSTMIPATSWFTPKR